MGLIETFFNWEVLVRAFPMLLRGLGNTVLLGVAAVFFGGLLGLAACLTRLYAPRPMRYLAIGFIDIFRATPILVVLIMIYYALPF
ncbi:ABC transporter permease subunit, partial [Rhizobiaceae sp. 2RAB30]